MSSSTLKMTAKSTTIAPIFAQASSSKRTLEMAVNDEDLTLRQSKVTKIDGDVAEMQKTALRIENEPTLRQPEHPKLSFNWLKSNPNTLLHGLYGSPVYSAKLAMFDIDGTLIKTKSGATFPKSATDFVIWCGKGSVQSRLREFRDKGYSIVLVSNQNYKVDGKPFNNFKGKMPLLAKELGVPFRIFAATAKDNNRKPAIGIYTLLSQLFAAQGITIDKPASFYIGDAAGRKIDHSNSDREWARNVGVTFYTPEDFFLNRKDQETQFKKVELDPQAKAFVPAAVAEVESLDKTE